ncbi:asparagine synthase-related protein [Candidatus Odyssella thessalonicensis]|uniref:asparagine synthase-related protein n=1 Tax=Candidatus Odyssella thessalonicensis TaxID=84647 RepID=UPI000225A98F|nr:asparagine synthase-related protein [Candidatus Odyssella thessalonicensis]
MIYLGFIQLNQESRHIYDPINTLALFTSAPPVFTKKGPITLCYGKLSEEQDLDEVWENESSLLIGRIFDKSTHRSFSKEKFQGLLNFNKDNLLKDAWGKYVYLHNNKKTSQIEIVVDSTGQLPFFYYPFPDGSLLFSSSIEIIYKVLAQTPEYNWEYLCAYLIHGNSSSIQTPFKNIFELPPACCLTISKNERKIIPFWNPLNSYQEEKKQSPDVVNILQDTLKPWIEPYKNVCVSLSGGLDSSSILYCLKDLVREDQNLTALNYFHSQIKSSNELFYARKVAHNVGVDLIEVDASESLPFDPPRNKLPIKPNKPLPGMVSLRWSERTFEQLSYQGSFAFISGHGSDHIFMCPPTKRTVADYFFEKGLKGFKTKLEDVANFYRDPLFMIFKESMKAGTSYLFGTREEKRSYQHTLKNLPNWITHDVLERPTNHFAHPIYEVLPKRVLPGKYDQINFLYDGIASIQIELNKHADPTYYPFLYQPLVEHALSYPTYALFEKGHDRYPLRRAIGERFNTETIWRRDKSQTTGIFQLGIRNNLKNILELCLEGEFAKQGLIHKQSLYKTILLIGSGDIKNMWPFIYLASSELFLKYWNGGNQ